MLDDFKEEQKLVYKTLINILKNNKISHAYIIESNEYDKAFEFSLAFAKAIICPYNYTNNKICKSCNYCKEIDNNDFLELKIIESEGQWIKKSQLDELQQEFSKKSIIGSRKIYIIKDAEKLNVSASNSILKFLEEPEAGITAILLCSNKNRLLSTIVSRCQVLSLKQTTFNNSLTTTDKINKVLMIPSDLYENTNQKIDTVVGFVKYFEENKLKTILYINKLWHDIFKEKDEIYIAFQIMILFYKDVLNCLLNENILIFNDLKQDVEFVASFNTPDIVINKINVIIELQKNIKFNVNSNMLMDKLIIELDRSK